MALFPAFADCASEIDREIESNEEEPKRETWLANPSYVGIATQPKVTSEQSTSSIEDAEAIEVLGVRAKKHQIKSPYRHHKEKKRKSSKSSKSSKESVKRRTGESDVSRCANENFHEDKTRQAGNLSVYTLNRPAIPWYFCRRLKPLGTKNWKMGQFSKSREKDRYYVTNARDIRMKASECTKEEEIEGGAATTMSGNENLVVWRTSRLENEVQNAVKVFKEKLVENPQNVRVWLEFVRFQERASELQFSGGYSKRALAERKLDILEKALENNPRSWLLLREKVNVQQVMYPPDELEKNLKKEAEETNCIGPWLAYLELVRMRGTTTEVSNNYGKTMDVARRERRTLLRKHGIESTAYDEQIIDLLLSCGLYMRQAGLWERLWTLIKMYLELNLKKDEQRSQDAFNLVFSAQSLDSEVEELEVEVLKSGLPLVEIWLRIERLRECTRWLPLSLSYENQTEEGDLQRLVFPEDVSELVHPLANAGKEPNGIIPRLASTALLLLKVPLLPFRDTAMRRHGFPSWSFDTPEVPLTAIFSLGLWDWAKEALPFDVLGEMVSGPQYLIPRPGRDLYLRNIQHVFMLLTEVAGSEADRQNFGVWWLRFERWLLMLEKLTKSNFTLSVTYKKSLPSTLKKFLSKENNRSSLALYREYALIEAMLGKTKSAIRTLCTAASLGGHPVVGSRDQAELCSVYRVLTEVLLKDGLDKFRQDISGIGLTNTAVEKTSYHSKLSYPYANTGSNFPCQQISANDEIHKEDEFVRVFDSCNQETHNLNAKDEDNVINFNVKECAVVKTSRWDVKNTVVGETGGRRPRWTSAGIFMGSCVCDDSDIRGVNESSNLNEGKNIVEESVNVTNVVKERMNSRIDVSSSSHSSSEQIAIVILTHLGIGKALGSLEDEVSNAEIESSLEKYRHVFMEVMKEEGWPRKSLEISEQDGCWNCEHKISNSLGGMEVFRSYFVVEWVSCRAWLLSLVESAWAAGAAYEEALSGIPKISSEQLEMDECKNTCGVHGHGYNHRLIRTRNIREALYEGYMTMLLSRRWSQEGRSGLSVILADVMRRALGEFPENTYFAAGVAATENDIGFGGSPWWIVNSYFDNGLNGVGVLGKVFLVLLAEQRKRRVLKGTAEGHTALGLGGPVIEDSSATNRVHSVLRRLLVDSGIRSCPLLWRLCLRFVGASGGVDACKGLIYRGIQSCPWSKAFYLDAATLLPEEVNRLQDLLTERELRVHVSPEELEVLRT